MDYLDREVDWEYQRQIASVGVRYPIGVKGGINKIEIKRKASISAVKSDIGATLKRRVRLVRMRSTWKLRVPM
jgi:hypothetical protein